MSKPKGKRPVAVKPRRQKTPVFSYSSVCCGEQATKAPLEMPQGRGIGQLGSVPETEDKQGLAGWRCSKCRKACKCTRQLNKKEEPVNDGQEG